MVSSMTSPCEEALGYWDVGIQYLHLVEAVSDETVKQGNPWMVTLRQPINGDDFQKETKWSDYNLVIPLLFNFYHGHELLLKGFIAAKGQQLGSSHKLTALLDKFNKLYPREILCYPISKYILDTTQPKIIKDFLQQALGTTIDDYYQFLKYPRRKGGNLYSHRPLQYKDEEGVQFFADLSKDIKQLRRKTVALGKEICPIVKKKRTALLCRRLRRRRV